MRAKILLTTISVLALGIAGNITTANADDVYVNLSVLDSLGENNSPVINQGPLFPVMSPAEAQASRRVNRPKKKAPIRKKAKAETKVKKAVAEEKIKLPEKQDIKVTVPAMPENVAEMEKKIEQAPVTVTAEKTDSESLAPTAETKIPVANAQTTENVAASSSQAPDNTQSAPLSAETAPADKPQNEAGTLAVPTDQTIPNKVEVTPTPVDSTPNKSIEDKKVVDIEQALENNTASQSENKDVLTPVANTVAEQVAQENVAPEKPKEEKPSLLVQQTQVAVAPAKVTENSASEIYFAAESDELSEENKTQIDNIIKGFVNPKENKIAIYSFNLNDGEDSFRKKRLSLNRAITVRSYLLGKGYKNFSIKVVNLNEADGKENSVRIEELK